MTFGELCSPRTPVEAGTYGIVVEDSDTTTDLGPGCGQGVVVAGDVREGVAEFEHPSDDPIVIVLE